MNSLMGENLSYVVVLGALGLLPLVLMACTSYLKISIVFSILRNALGGGQIPSQAMSGVIALVLTVFTMSPVFTQCLNACHQLDLGNGTAKFGDFIPKVYTIGEPLITFMRKNTAINERAYFLDFHSRRSAPEIKVICDQSTGMDEYRLCIDKNEAIPSLLLAYLVSELRAGCTIGVYLFLPFLAIDLTISTLLTALGMMMVSPVTISLPIKLMLFVVSDGWRLLLENLILSYHV